MFNDIQYSISSQLEEMKKEIKLSETLKIYVIKDHFKYYFDQTGQNFRETNGENLESSHSSLRLHEERHKFHAQRKIGSPLHGELSNRSLVFYNSKRARMTPAINRIRSPNISPASSPIKLSFSI